MTNPADLPGVSRYPVHLAARHALSLGLCPVPAAVDGTKRPRGEWKQYQASRPTQDQVDSWFGSGHAGWGVICGPVSGGLEMLELEGRAMAEGMWDDFCERCDAKGLTELVNRVAYDGYTEETPSSGIHMLFRVDGAPLGNLKLARRLNGDDIQVLFETRGEGGFVVLAPSNGATHPSGRPWKLVAGGLASIATITEAERDALYDVARSFDAMPERPVVPMPKTYDLKPFTLTSGESWFNAVVAELSLRSWGDILDKYGLHHHHDSGEISYWTRPGKDTKDGYSATTNAKGTDRLIVFTSAMPLEEWSGNGPAPSYDRLDVIAAYEYAHDRTAAAKALRGPTIPRIRPHGVDPVTGEITNDGTHLPEEFWQSRPVLQQIRQAAWSRSRSGDAYLAAVLARLAAITHPSIRLPAIVAAPAPLTLYVSLVGRSGGGKSSTVTGATELLPYEGTQVADNMPLGSGEGLIELFYDMVMEEDANGKMKPVKRQTRHGAFVYLDEGQALAELGNRKGSTLLPMLRTAWSGVVLGTSNASTETKRKLPAGSYALGLVIAFQPSKAAELLADTAGGTPQRFVWIEGIDPNVPDTLPEWPGPLDWRPPPIITFGDTTMTIPESIAAPIRVQAIKLTRGQIQPDELDSHATLAQMKVAGLLAVLDGRMDINAEDWQLATMFQKVSHRVRANVLAAVAIEQRKAEESAISRHVGRERAVVDDKVDSATYRMAKAIGRHVHRATCENGCSVRCATHATSSGDRHLAAVSDAIDRGVGLKWIKVVGDAILPGEARPT